jgi:acetylornithine deacetylase
MMLALRQLVEEEARLPRSVCLAATVDEEFAQSGVQRLVESEMQFSAAIVGEPTSLHVVAAHKGQVYFKVVTHGKAAHTSTPEHGLNAIYLMSDVIHVLRMRSTVEYSQRVHPLCGSPALTVAIIHGGSSEHVVPDACEIAVDCRLIPGESWPEAVAEMQRWVAEDLGEEDGKRVAFQLPYHNAPPMQTPIEHPLVQGLRQAAANVLGEAQVVGVPYNTDAGILSVCGVPSVVFGPGDIAQAHTDAEFVEIKQVTAGVEILKRFLLEYTA